MKTPSEFFRKAIIGKIKTKPMNCVFIRDGVEEPMTYPSEEFDVIDATWLGKCQVYISNQWHKEYKNEPQVVAFEMVESFTPCLKLVEE